jgi:tripartite-type tricarboxylate transporter receptor subunit TctC
MRKMAKSLLTFSRKNRLAIMMKNFRNFTNTLALVIAALGAALSSSHAAAQATGPYPNKPVKIVVGFAPGGAADYVARTISEPLSRALGQTVVIENKPGAGSSIAAALVAKAPADGYTVLIASPSSISVNPTLNPKVGYSTKELTPVTKITSSPLVVAVNTGLGINSLRDLIDRAKKQPGALNYATSGNGSAPHLGAALFSQVAGVDMVHIPFKGGAPAIQSVIAGDTQVTFGTPPSVLPMMQAGRLKGLAVTQKEGSALVPGVPGTKAAGLPDYAIEFWYGIFVPTGTPPEAAKKLFDSIQTALSDPKVKAALAREGTDVDLSKSPEQFVNFLNEDGKFWVQLVKSAGVKAE